MKRAIVVALLLSTFVPVSSLHANVVNMPDPNLRAAVRNHLELSAGEPITEQHMVALTRLGVTDHGITDLTGLEYARNLTRLYIGRNPIDDLSPISELTTIEKLYMWATPVSDLTPLAKLTRLRDFLASYGGEIMDIGPLVNLTQLERINLSGNKIKDISALTNLNRLRTLQLNNNRIEDVSPLAKLTDLTHLELNENRITDVRPLAHLTQLTTLSLAYNPLFDLSPLDGLSLEYFTHDSYGCDMMPLPLEPRIENRTFPSIFTAWSDKDRWPLFDLIFCCPRFGMRLVDTDNGVQFHTPNPSWDEAIRIRDDYLAQNPTMVFLHGLAVIWGDTEKIPEDSPWWLRDENGDILYRWGNTRRGYMNLNHPGWQQRMIDIAATIDKCGLYDGIFIDGWRESSNARRGQVPGQIAILKGIRERVRENFLIMVNTNDHQAPASAPYINGLFMETGFPQDSTTPEAIEHELMEIENTLKWADETLLEPRITGLGGDFYSDEPPNSPKNMQWMRAITTLSLTFSNSYVAFPLRGGPWYDFWNADLGRPVGDTLQLHEDRAGVYIREFTKGWAVYNHSGDAQIVTLPEEVQSAATGISNSEHAVLNLDGDIFLRLPPKLPGDVNADGVVNILDLTLVAQAMGTDNSKGDVNGDGVINIIDLVFVANQF